MVFPSRFGHKEGIDFGQFGQKYGMVFTRWSGIMDAFKKKLLFHLDR